ncbi:MAG: serine/threonine-protein phosphatase [Acidobacteria bacterium]|nr:serine/threonine-protein phosphatase [Acidobacteriota bacterium]
MQRIRCAEVWGGNARSDFDVCTRGVTASLFSHTSEGGTGGDIYYFSLCSHDLLTRVLLADVRGHGAEAAEIGQWIYQGLEKRMNSLDGATVLAELNTLVRERGFEALTSAVLVSHYAGDSHLYYSYAGHPPALLRKRGEQWTPLTIADGPAGPANLPLGVLATTRYDQARVPVESGDRIVLYSDGVTECPSGGDEMLDTAGLAAWLAEAGEASPEELKRSVVKKLKEQAGEDLLHDDCTMIVLEMH